MLVQQVARSYGERVKVVNEDFGASPLAERYGITQYPAVFVGEALIARPRDFYLWGSTEEGRYTPWSEPANRQRFQEDVRRMIDTVLGGGAIEGVELTDADRRTLAALPEFATRDLAGVELTSTALSGKVVVVEFWATWCPPCRGTLAWLAELKRRHGDRVAVVAIAIESDEADVRRVSAGIAGPLRWALGSPELARAFGDVSAIPTLLLFDRAGRPAASFLGAPPGLHAEVEAALDGLVESPATAPGGPKAR